MKRYLSIILICFVFLFSTQSLFADTQVGGNISDDTTWTLSNSPYTVTSTVQILEGAKLTIEPGVEISFNQSTSLTIGGELNAIGTDIEVILFTSNLGTPSAGDWGPIKFVDTAISATYNSTQQYTDGCIIKNCIVEYGMGISSTGTSLYISDNVINNNGNNGLIFNNNCSNSIVLNNHITNNVSTQKGAGILISSGGGNDILIKENIIKYNSTSDTGGGITTYEHAVIENNIVSDNIGNSAGGIQIAESSNVNNNQIANNIGCGIMGGDHQSIISNNYIAENDNSSGDWNDGGGIVSRGAKIINNQIINNISGGYGGGIYLWSYDSSTIIIENNSILGNQALENGGGLFIRIQSQDVSIKNNKLNGNTASVNGNEIYIWENCLSFQASNNNIKCASAYCIYNDSSDSFDFSNNYWGTTDTSIIDQQIYDYYDDITKGKVIYDPIASPLKALSSILMILLSTD